MNGTNKGVDYGLVTLEIQGPPLMPPGLNSNGRTLAGRRGVAVPPPGSQMFAHMRSLNNGTLAARVPTAGPMASLGRDQMAPPTSVPGGEFFLFFLLAATREMPNGRRIGRETGARAERRCQARKIDKHAFTFRRFCSPLRGRRGSSQTL